MTCSNHSSKIVAVDDILERKVQATCGGMALFHAKVKALYIFDVGADKLTT